jgi:hypothetical protein
VPVDGGGGKLLERSASWPMCIGLADWRSDGGDGVWFLRPTEEVMESVYCMELGVAMALEMASRLWTMVLAGVTVGMVR